MCAVQLIFTLICRSFTLKWEYKQLSIDMISRYVRMSIGAAADRTAQTVNVQRTAIWTAVSCPFHCRTCTIRYCTYLDSVHSYHRLLPFNNSAVNSWIPTRSLTEHWPYPAGIWPVGTMSDFKAVSSQFLFYYTNIWIGIVNIVGSHFTVSPCMSIHYLSLFQQMHFSQYNTNSVSIIKKLKTFKTITCFDHNWSSSGSHLNLVKIS
jgi:hypothetical protein